MVNKGLALDETIAGQSLNRDLIEQQKKHKEEMKNLEADMRKAIDQKDEEAVEAIAQMQSKFQMKINQGAQDVLCLQASIESLKKERDRDIKQIQHKLHKIVDQYARKEKEWQRDKENNVHDLAELAKHKLETQQHQQQIQDLIG